jgi:glycyl-tRNA synthetase beta chain
VTHHPAAALVPLFARRLLAVLPEFTGTEEFRSLAMVFKRVRNIAKNMPDDEFERLTPDIGSISQVLTEPAEKALVQDVMSRRGGILFAYETGTGYREALASAALYGPTVAKFFDDVMVMTDDAKLRQARLFLMKALEFQILRLADVSEIVPEADKQE